MSRKVMWGLKTPDGKYLQRDTSICVRIAPDRVALISVGGPAGMMAFRLRRGAKRYRDEIAQLEGFTVTKLSPEEIKEWEEEWVASCS